MESDCCRYITNVTHLSTSYSNNVCVYLHDGRTCPRTHAHQLTTNASRFGPFPVRPLSRSASYPLGPLVYICHQVTQMWTCSPPTNDHLPSPVLSQQTQNICITFIQRRPNVFAVGPTLYKVIQMFCVHWDEPVSASSQVR